MSWILQNWQGLATGVVLPYVISIVGGVTTCFINQDIAKDDKESSKCTISKNDACGICEAEEMWHRLDGKLEEICQAAYNRDENIQGKRNSWLVHAPEYIEGGALQ